MNERVVAEATATIPPPPRPPNRTTVLPTGQALLDFEDDSIRCTRSAYDSSRTVADLREDEVGLRERKKRRTRATIERVALDLFAKHGFQATTLAEIADAAEIAPSTLHAYFPSKDDIIFSSNAAVTESARARIVDRPENESAVDALRAWITEDAPRIGDRDGAVRRRRRAIIENDDQLLIQERLHTALLEDVLAEAFARDLQEQPDDLRSRLMAAVVVNGLRAIWFWWYRQQPETHPDAREPWQLEATYLTSVVQAAEAAIANIPQPDEETH
jgi:AcrR family transcriptional regulator